MKKETEIEKRAREIGSEPAFPTSSLEGAFGSTGLTKLELFAGMALRQIPFSIGGANPSLLHNAAREEVNQATAICWALAEMEVNNG